MSAWAYRCHSPHNGEAEWFVSQADVAELSPEVEIVRVKVGKDWQCAVLDRSQKVAVETQLLRNLTASDEKDCPQCAAWLAAHASGSFATASSTAKTSGQGDNEKPSASFPVHEKRVTVQAAAISLTGIQLMVVVAPLSLVASPGEANMAIDDLQPHFGGAPVVLMAQKEDGSPSYYGDSQLVELLADISIDKMPWKDYPVG